MRICIYTDSALPKLGGQELVVDALARQFLDLGHEPVVLAPNPRRAVALNDHALPYRVQRHPRFLSTRYLVGYYQRYVRGLHRRWPFDVLHCHNVYPSGYVGTLARRSLGVPVVITSHGDARPDNFRFRKPGLRERFVQTLQNADTLIAISEFLAQSYRQLCPRHAPIVQIPNGVCLEEYAAVMGDTRLPFGLSPQNYLVFLGRLAHRKGVDVLLDAYGQIPEERRLPLLIVGDGEERAALESQAARLGLPGHVHFAGARRGEDKIRLLQHARFAVLPTRTWEGMPLVALEAYAAGCPVIATNAPGLREVVQPGRTGCLVNCDRPSELAAAITSLLSQPALVQEMRRNVREYIADYNWRSVAQRHVTLFEEMLAGTVRTRAA